MIYVNAGIIASKRCDHLKIHDNEVRDGGPEAIGIFLHRSGDDSEIYSEYCSSCRAYAWYMKALFYRCNCLVKKYD